MAFDVDGAMEEGVALHRKGRLQEAGAIYKQVVQQQPNHAGAGNLLGVLAQQAGMPDVSADLMREANRLAPEIP